MEGYSQNSKPSAPYQLTKLTLPYNLEDDQCDQEDSYPSDCESGISGSQKSDNPVMIRMDDGDKICEFIKKQLVSSLSSYGFSTQVEAISRKDYSKIMSRVKYQSFCLYSKGIEIRRRGNANVKYAWYGGASKNELTSILSHGFSLSPNTSGVYGRQGVYLSPVDHPLESVQSSTADENGLRHMLLCRVILGNTEVIHPGSGQYTPSSEEFDSGVDNLVSPKKYIIWNGKMNTHILPDFLVSFRTSSYCSCSRETNTSPRVPKSDWMSFPSLIDHLSKFLPCQAIKLISQHHNDYRKKNITRHEMIRLVRHIAGDELLIMIIKKGKRSER